MPASKTLKKTFGGLQKIMGEKNKKKRELMLMAAAKNEDILNSVRELSRNVVLKNVPLNNRQKKSLLNHSKCIVGCSKIKGCCKKSERLVTQSGGWLGIVLPIVASLIADKLL